jgi:hypothetical protein
MRHLTYLVAYEQGADRLRAAEVARVAAAARAPHTRFDRPTAMRSTRRLTELRRRLRSI